MRKYRNKKVVDDGITFDSLAEHQRYLELKLLLRAGEIGNLELHPKYMLQPGYYSNYQQKRIPAITYTADFAYIERGKKIVEDVKGFRTTAFNLKRRLFEFKYPDLIFRLTGS